MALALCFAHSPELWVTHEQVVMTSEQLHRDRPAAADLEPRAERRTHRAQGTDWVPWLIVLGALAIYLTISVSRYLRLQPTSYDLGIFTEYVKQFAHLQAPIVDARAPGMDLLGDHFHPIVALIAPFFRLFPSPVTLLVAQALLAAFSIIPVIRAAEPLGIGAARAIGVAYGLSWGLQQLVNYDFHEIAFAVPLLALSLSALVRDRVRTAVLWALPLVLVKEDQGFTVAAIGLLIAFRYRHQIAGLALAAWGLGWSLVAITVIIPHFNPDHTYQYWSTGGALGASGYWGSPVALLDQFFASSQVKLPTLAMILLPTAFIALRSPVVLTALPSLVLRFISTNSSYWGTAWHYNATVMPIVFIAAIDGLIRLRAARGPAEPGLPSSADRAPPPGTLRWPAAIGDQLQQHGAAMMLAICVAVAFQFPVSSLWNPQTYQPGPHAAAARSAMALIPSGATVATDIDLLAPLGARADAFWLGNSSLYLGRKGNPATQYVVYDQTVGDLPPAAGTALNYVQQLSRGAKYRQIFASNGIFVFVRS
jgi:uncharacterized membrane protein